MSNRAELLEATLESFPEGVGLLGEDSHVVFWNHAAQAITGYSAIDLVGRPAPDALKALLEGVGPDGHCEPGHSTDKSHGLLLHARHKLGHDISTLARTLVLRDGLGHRTGTAVLFHPAESLDALPRGEVGEDQDVEASQEDLTSRLETLFEDFAQGGQTFGVLWIRIDQGHEMRRTHGGGACEAMFKKVEHALATGLRPAEHLGRWGEDEFLVISHERTPAMLATHAEVLVGLARMADFRWWGDRIPVTVSIGAVQAKTTDKLAALLERAKAAMLLSSEAGGDRTTNAPEDHSCSQS
jgi:diguanylate cyclase (GGDEF)-like protein